MRDAIVFWLAKVVVEIGIGLAVVLVFLAVMLFVTRERAP